VRAVASARRVVHDLGSMRTLLVSFAIAAVVPLGVFES